MTRVPEGHAVIIPVKPVTLAPRPYYGPAPVYVAPPPPPAYAAPVYEAPPCYWTRGEPMWNGVAWVRPRVQVCD